MEPLARTPPPPAMELRELKLLLENMVSGDVEALLQKRVRREESERLLYC